MRQKIRDKLARIQPTEDKETSTAAPSSTATSEDGAVRSSPSKGRSPLLNRQNAVQSLGSGRQQIVKRIRHPPGRVRLWEEHNRDYSLLSSKRCADLIEGFKRTGRQEFPAIVRRVEDDGNADFELICGARRHWTAAYLGWDLLIEVRDLDDRQAFILQDLENRDREDISDYERACDYTQALPKYFGNNATEMAQFLQVDRSNFSRLLDLAKLPDAIVAAYTDVRDLKAHHGAEYKKLLADARTRRNLIDTARRLAGQDLDGKEVFSALKRAGTGSTPKSKRAKARTPVQRFGALTVERIKDNHVSLSLDLPTSMDAASREDLEKAWHAFLESLPKLRNAKKS